MLVKLILPFVIVMSMHISAFSQDQISFNILNFERHELRQAMERNGGTFMNEINQAYQEGREPVFDRSMVVREAEVAVQEMWRMSPFYINEETIIESASRLSNGFYEVRNIQAHFVDPMGEKHHQDILLEFTPTGMVRTLKIGLESHRYHNILNRGTSVTDTENRRMILSFVEEFRTSYNRQDIDFIEKVFSDQALIIVGRVLESTGERSSYEEQAATRVELLQFTKNEYIDRLRRIFAQNEWIDVVFEEIEIRQHPQHENVYGVYLTQYYRSSTYSDDGYLFTLIDFRKEKPQIHVRTWEPKNAVREEYRFSLGDLRVL